jgi:peptidoglycan/LPS O-acetylase OafA/YrhL
LLPEQLLHFGGSVTATAIFASNVFFWTGTGYFEPNADWLPLLHTWSLAVEEQYYIVFPILMGALWRRLRRSTILVLSLAMAVSFGVAVYGSHQTPSAAFYLLPHRAWELLLGAVLALVGRIPWLENRSLREACAAAGVAMLVAALVLIDSQTVFPGTSALAPCLGAALVLTAGAHGRSTVGAMLSTKPMVAVGLISYSLYLWHWPIFVFMRLVSATNPLPVWSACLGIAASVVIATACWRYVERPFRDVHVGTRMQVFAFAVGASYAAIGVGTLIQGMDGARWRFNPATLAYADATNDYAPLRGFCKSATFEVGCQFGGRLGDAPTYAIWGDSHALALAPAVELAMGPQTRGVLHQAGACAPLLGAQRHKVLLSQGECYIYNTDVAARLTARDSPIETVFLAARWALWMEGTTPIQGDSVFTAISDQASLERSREENRRVFLRGLQRTVTALRSAGKTVILVGPIPEYSLEVPTLLALSTRWSVSTPRGVSAIAYRGRNAFVVPALTRVAAGLDAHFIDLGPLFCSQLECLIVHGGKSLYTDADHLSLHGARSLVGPYLEKLLTDVVLNRKIGDK